MFRIVTNLLEEFSINFVVTIGGQKIARKKYILDLTGTNVPTFSPNFYEYNDDEFSYFIECIEKDIIGVFAFDNDDANKIFDGLSYANNTLLVITSYNWLTHTTMIYMTDETRPAIVADLKAFQANIQEVIKKRIDLANELDVNKEDDEPEKTEK